MSVPANLKYTKSHEWIHVEGDIAIIGITDHAQSELGDIVHLDLPEVGRILGKDDIFGSVDSVKTVSDLYAPVAGEVVETNPTLGAQPELLNTDPYSGGWVIKIKMSDASQLESLLNAEDYEAGLH
jgi:glycine cleavage system H protein